MKQLSEILNEAMRHVSDVIDIGICPISAETIDELTDRFLRTFYPDEYKEFFK